MIWSCPRSSICRDLEMKKLGGKSERKDFAGQVAFGGVVEEKMAG